MKTLLATATALLSLAALSGPVAAQQTPAGVAAAVAHFNADKTPGERTVLTVDSDVGAAVSTRSGRTHDVFARFNADADSQDDLRGQVGATRYDGSPSFGSAIFDRINAE